MMDCLSAFKKLLKDVKRGKVSPVKALERLRRLPYQDLGFAKIDHHRVLRKGIPEVVFCQGKTNFQVEKIVKESLFHEETILLTRVRPSLGKALKRRYPQLEYDVISRLVFRKKKTRPKRGLVAVITAGTSDIPVAEEAAVTLEVFGNKVERIYDVGVAGLHRILDKGEVLRRANVLVVAAGMEGALASIVGGLVAKPVIALPTSIGYGANFKGLSALLGMLNSCAPGVAVVNIDNGFGAGYFAHIINK